MKDQPYIETKEIKILELEHQRLHSVFLAYIAIIFVLAISVEDIYKIVEVSRVTYTLTFGISIPAIIFLTAVTQYKKHCIYKELINKIKNNKPKNEL